MWLDRPTPQGAGKGSAERGAPRSVVCVGSNGDGIRTGRYDRLATERSVRSLIRFCSERTINFHLANAMARLKVDNKLAAIQRACWFGLI